MAALNQSLARTVAGGSEEEMEEDQLDDIPMADGSQNPEALEAAKAAAEELHRLKSLFKGKRYNNVLHLNLFVTVKSFYCDHYTGWGRWSVTQYLGWLYFDLGVPPSCPTDQPILPNFHLSNQNQAASGMSKIEVNPTQVTDHLPHPVVTLSRFLSARCAMLR